MAEKTNRFGYSFKGRAEDQSKPELTVKRKKAPHTVSADRKKRGANATTMTLAISREDKDKVKLYAALHGTTVSDMLHEWISALSVEG